VKAYESGTVVSFDGHHYAYGAHGNTVSVSVFEGEGVWGPVLEADRRAILTAPGLPEDVRSELAHRLNGNAITHESVLGSFEGACSVSAQNGGQAVTLNAASLAGFVVFVGLYPGGWLAALRSLATRHRVFARALRYVERINPRKEGLPAHD
jgi:hypothetical protein